MSRSTATRPRQRPHRDPRRRPARQPVHALSSIANGSTVNLIGNSRTGAEVNQTGLITIGVPRTQYCQTYQFPVQIGGSAQTARAQVMPGGIQTPFDFNMTVQLQNMVDDIENSLLLRASPRRPVDNTVDHGQDERPAVDPGDQQHLVLARPRPTPSAYGSTDLIRDTLQAARTGGGEPDLLVVSTNFMSGFATWGQAIQRIPAGETVFGTPINVLEAPFLHGVTIVEAPLLRPYTAIASTSSEVYIRNKRNPYWNLRGNRGDMVEGDWIAEMAIEVVNESITPGLRASRPSARTDQLTAYHRCAALTRPGLTHGRRYQVAIRP